MTEWKTVARDQQIRWKRTTRTLPPEARVDGPYFVNREETGFYQHCLPYRFATYNVLATVREEALARLNRFGIAWHSGTPGVGPSGNAGPTTNLLSSQVQCVNSLLSLEVEAGLLLERLRAVEPDARKLIPIRHPRPGDVEGFVAFEWIGRENYLGERFRGKRKRGSKVTSADALIVLERSDGGRTGVLIEWKFTESYHQATPFVTLRGTDRRDIYRARYEVSTAPFILEKPSIDAYFHEPHYQLLRLSLLAEGMLEAGEHEVDRMVVLYLAPGANRALMDCVPDGLRSFGNTVDAVWRILLPGPRVRFVCHDSGPWATATRVLIERYGELLA